METMNSKNQVLHLHPKDNVGIARIALHPGVEIEVERTSREQSWLTASVLKVRELIPAGHKVALTHLDPGEPVRRYGEVIGTASKEINPGEHIHTHNLAMPHSVDEDNLDVRLESVIPIRESALPVSTALGRGRSG